MNCPQVFAATVALLFFQFEIGFLVGVWLGVCICGLEEMGELILVQYIRNECGFFFNRVSGSSGVRIIEGPNEKMTRA